MQRRQGWASTFFWDICPFMKVTPLACQVRSDSFCFIGIILLQRQLHVSVQWSWYTAPCSHCSVCVLPLNIFKL